MADREGESPEETRQRASYSKSTPVPGPSEFDKKATVWYTTPQGQQLTMEVVDLQQDALGKYTYQIKGADGKLYENGKWVDEDSLSYR
ncbi:MAG: hypothetical protein Q9227_008973 [Pyrenula ochraceoflavens]